MIAIVVVAMVMIVANCDVLVKRHTEWRIMARRASNMRMQQQPDHYRQIQYALYQSAPPTRRIFILQSATVNVSLIDLRRIFLIDDNLSDALSR